MIEHAIEILLVEDNPNDVKLTLHAFESNNLANRVHVLRDGAEALEFLFGKDDAPSQTLVCNPKVILLDLKLPLVNGLEVLERIKGDERTRRIPVVVLTSSREDQDVRAAYALGANSYIVKPVDFEKFTTTVRELGYYWFLLNESPTLPEVAQDDSAG